MSAIGRSVLTGCLPVGRILRTCNVKAPSQLLPFHSGGGLRRGFVLSKATCVVVEVEAFAFCASCSSWASLVVLAFCCACGAALLPPQRICGGGADA